MEYTDYQIRRLKAWGYTRISRRHGIIARVDRPDWREYMAYKHAPWDPLGQGMQWVLGMEDRAAADYYCGVHSKDRIEGVPLHVSDQLNKTVDGYVAKPDEKPRIAIWQAATAAQGRRRWQCTGVTGKRVYGPTMEAAYQGLIAIPAGV